MSKLWQKISVIVILLVSVFWLNANIAQAAVNPEEMGKVVQEIESLDVMRSGLAVTLEGSTEEPTLETFKQVCKPVGMKAKQLSEENGWKVKQIAQKYRNPAHAPNLHDKMALAKFEQNPELIGFWEQDTDGVHYYRRINVEATCLACHGGKNSRPKFVQDKYPQDLAYDFQVGDLRGMYSVLIPDSVKEQLPE
jgi:hypothetical protein